VKRRETAIKKTDYYTAGCHRQKIISCAGILIFAARYYTMRSLKNLLSIIPYPLFPVTGAGKKSILNFNNYMSDVIDAHAINVRYSEPPAVKFDLLQLFGHSKLRYINPFIVFRVKKAIHNTNADFLLIEHPYMGWMGVVLKRLTGIKWGIRSHNIEYARFKDFGKWWWPILKRYELYLYRKADAVFFITDDDRNSAGQQCRIQHSFVMPTGILINALPTDSETCRQYLRRQHGIQPDEKILLYNGALDYKPNKEALDTILNEINPRLEQTAGFKYKIIVCGSGLDDSYNRLQQYKEHNIIYCGFVDDISIYFKGADLYLNPVIGGGGIKTRLVEAVAYNTDVVSTQNGAIGFHMETVEKKLAIVPDHDWQAFAQSIIDMCGREKTDATAAFYQYYSWENIVSRFIDQVNPIL